MTSRFLTISKPLIILLFVLSINFPLSAGGPIYKIWNTSNSSIPTNNLSSIFIDSEEIIWIGSNDKGLIKFDGVNFIFYNTTNSPMKSDMVRDITSDKFDNLWIGTIKQGAGNQGALMKYDKINNWSFYNTTNSGIASGNNWSVAVDTNNIVWAAWFKLSKFDGTSWVIYDSTNSPLKYGGCREIHIDKYNNKWIGQDFSGLYKLTNDTNWTFYNPFNSGLGGTEINKMREDSFGNLWITMSYYGMTKFNPVNNNWQNWTPQNSNLHSVHPWGLFVDKNNTKWIGFGFGDSLAAFDSSVFSYYPPYNAPIHDIRQDSLGNLWIASSQGLIQFNKNGIVGINSSQTTVPGNFKIEKIYPNPFNPVSHIEFSVNKPSNIVIKICDLSGKEIETLANTNYPQGTYQVTWNAAGFPSGIYFVSLYVNDNFYTAKKLSLVK